MLAPFHPLRDGYVVPLSFAGAALFEIDEIQNRRQNCFHGPGRTTDLPDCGAYLILALPPGGKGPRTFHCFDCDRPDPLKTDQVKGWLAGELGRTEPPATE